MRARILFAVLATVTLLCTAPRASAKKVRTGALSVQVNVPDADIAVDGEVVARSPMAEPVKLQAGKHSLKVTKPGHAEFLDVVAITAGKTEEVSVELIAFAARVVIGSRPPGALVLVDEKPVGKTPYQGDLDPGEHHVRLVLDGYVDTRKNVQLVAGEPYQTELVLVPVPRPVETRRELPLYRRWWVWTAAGVVLTGAVVTAAVAGHDDPLAGAETILRPTWP